MGRGVNKGKRGGRGGARRSYVTSLEDMEARNTRESAWSAKKKDGEESGSEESDDNIDHDAAAAEAAFDKLKLEEEENKAVRFKGTQGVIEIENPNLAAKGGKNIKLKDMDAEAEPAPLTRREREVVDAERKKQHYIKMHAAGETDEAKNDMERLAIVRARREQQAKERATASEEMTEEEKKRRTFMANNATRSSSEESSSEHESGSESDKKVTVKSAKPKGPKEEKPAKAPKIEKLNPIEVKKMNPAKVKELLKERGENVQGTKKDLVARLLAWESEHHG